MCLTSSNVRSQTQWNWDGDLIVHSPVIRKARKVAGKWKKRFDTDIRGYLSDKDNAVVAGVLDTIASGLPDEERALFYSHRRGSFDFRMRKVTEYIAAHISYRRDSRAYETWQYPEETLALGTGDCEDQAFLLASLLLASGISGYVVRVAMGRLYDQAKRSSRDHVWVMYRNESGLWMLIEPLLYTKGAQRRRWAPRRSDPRRPRRCTSTCRTSYSTTPTCGPSRTTPWT